MQLNELYFAGHVGKDAESFTTKTGKQIVSFNLCHTIKGKNGAKDATTWIRAKVFGAWCESAIQIKKGDNVFVKGTLQISEYTKDNEKRTMVEVLANSISIMKKFERAKETEYAPPEEDYSHIPF